MGQTSLRQLNPFRTVAAWKKSDAPRPDLLSVILFGFLSNVFLIIGISLNLNARVGTEGGATVLQHQGVDACSQGQALV
jgi:hypothetical protein